MVEHHVNHVDANHALLVSWWFNNRVVRVNVDHVLLLSWWFNNRVNHVDVDMYSWYHGGLTIMLILNFKYKNDTKK